MLVYCKLDVCSDQQPDQYSKHDTAKTISFFSPFALVAFINSIVTGKRNKRGFRTKRKE